MYEEKGQLQRQNTNLYEARIAKETHRFDTTELYLNLIQVHCLYRVYLQELKSWKGNKWKEKKTLDTTEVLAKSIYMYVIY